VHEKLAAHAHARASKLSEEEVLAALKEQGITDLNSLVQKSLADIRASGRPGGSPFFDTFIYSQFVYRVAMPIDKGVISELGG
jgi:hypothetical protein